MFSSSSDTRTPIVYLSANMMTCVTMNEYTIVTPLASACSAEQLAPPP